MNSKEFSQKIENISKEKRISHIDAIIWFCEQNELDLGSVGSMVNKSLKEKIKAEAIRLRMVKDDRVGKGVLPI